MLQYESYHNELNPFITQKRLYHFPFFNFNRWQVTCDGLVSGKAKLFLLNSPIIFNEHQSLKSNPFHENVHRQLIWNYMFYQKLNAITNVTPGIFTDQILAIFTNYHLKEGTFSCPTWIHHHHQGMDALMKNQLTMVRFNIF